MFVPCISNLTNSEQFYQYYLYSLNKVHVPENLTSKLQKNIQNTHDR